MKPLKLIDVGLLFRLLTHCAFYLLRQSEFEPEPPTYPVNILSRNRVGLLSPQQDSITIITLLVLFKINTIRMKEFIPYNIIEIYFNC